VVVRDRRLLVRPRPAGAHLPDRWEFPGGKIGEGEDASAAALRELAEETGLSAAACEPLAVSVYDYPDRHVRLHAFLVREPEGTPDPSWNWLTLDELRVKPVPQGNGPILSALRWRL